MKKPSHTISRAFSGSLKLLEHSLCRKPKRQKYITLADIKYQRQAKQTTQTRLFFPSSPILLKNLKRSSCQKKTQNENENKNKKIGFRRIQPQQKSL